MVRKNYCKIYINYIKKYVKNYVIKFNDSAYFNFYPSKRRSKIKIHLLFVKFYFDPF